MNRRLALPLLLLLAQPLRAEEPMIEDATAQRIAAGWTISVTLRHPDTGWDHYADAWEVLSPDGTTLGLRELLHPHETEQPFTCDLAGVIVPEGIDHVLIRHAVSATDGPRRISR